MSDRRPVRLDVAPAGKGWAWTGRLFIDGVLVANIDDDRAGRAHLIADLLEMALARGIEIAPECVDA